MENVHDIIDASGTSGDPPSKPANHIQPVAPGDLMPWIYGWTLALIFALSLTGSLFFKANWLWMDEVLSYQLISDPSVAHLNAALVSGMDANPPFFPNLYWLIGHLSLHPQFLRMVSIALFAATVAFYFRFTTYLVGTTRANAVLIGLAMAFTYLNFTLATQIRSYAIFLLIALLHFITTHQLAASPRKRSMLIGQLVVAILLLFTHNFGLFYLATTGAFFALLWAWSRDRAYLFPLGAHVIAGLVWLLLWLPSFSIQAAAGKPHSWIPLPTLPSFFHIAGELAPSLSSRLERLSAFWFLAPLRFCSFFALFLFIAIPRVKRGFQSVSADPAFLFYLLAGFVYFGTLAIAVAVSFLHTSVFISRYLWPSHLLLVFQLVYAFHHFIKGEIFPARLRSLLPVYFAALAAFVFYQNRKIVVFPSGVVEYLTRLSPDYPVFVETADYFLPIWFQRKEIPVHYLLDWDSAAKPGNILGATVEHQILKSLAEHYSVPAIVPIARFTPKEFSHFYVVDESSVYGIERFLESGRITILREISIPIRGHRILECAFAPSVDAGVGANRGSSESLHVQPRDQRR